MAKRGTRLPSATTTNHKMQVRSWVAERMMIRQFGKALGPYFWRENRWKWKYMQEVKAATKFIKAYDEDMVLKVVCENKKLVTLASYGGIEFLLQNEQARLDRLSKKKDTSPVTYEVHASGEDLRGPRSTSRRTGLFDRLDNMENDDGEYSFQ